MPYAVKMMGKKHIVYNKETGKAHGTHDSHEKAMKQMRLLYMIEGGKQPTQNKKKSK